MHTRRYPLSSMGTTEPEHPGGHAVVARNVDKTFRVPEERTHTLKERVLHPRRRTGHEAFRAVRDISFAVEHGEFFGIVGRNGSGKSTLLKCLAGIYALDRGNIWISGRLSTFIELGVGFNADLAARDNVVMNGIMMGLSPREARARYDRVIDFAELGEFQELKLKNYSSGMHVRLAFSVAIQVDADVLLIDEVLAVGDAAFQQKCFDVFNEMRDSGKTIIFVTHDMGAVNRFCHRAMLLERGVCKLIGDPSQVADEYLELNFGRGSSRSDREGSSRVGDGHARVLETWLEDEHGERQHAVIQGRRMTLSARVRFEQSVHDPLVHMHLLDAQQQTVLVTSTAREAERSGGYAPGIEIIVSFAFDTAFAPGRYSPVWMLAHRGSGLDTIDKFESDSVVVTGASALGGLVDLPYETRIHRVEQAALHGLPA